MTGKRDIIKVQAAVYKPDIICITETKIDSNYDDNELLGDSYTVYRNDRKQGGGGVLTAFCNASPIEVINNSVGPGESLVTTVSFFSQVTLNIVTYYRPPGETQLDILFEIINDRDSRHPIIFTGDFNLPDILWEKGKGYIKGSSKRQNFFLEAVNLFNGSDLVQLVQGPTHKKGNTLDLFFVEAVLFDYFEFDCSMLPGISDHDIIFTEIVMPNYTYPKPSSKIPS